MWACTSVSSLVHGHVHKWCPSQPPGVVCPFVPGHVIYSCALLRKFLILFFFFFLNTERAYRVIGSVGLCIPKYPRRTCHLPDSCFCSGAVAWWLSFRRDPCCTRHWARLWVEGLPTAQSPATHQPECEGRDQGWINNAWAAPRAGNSTSAQSVFAYQAVSLKPGWEEGSHLGRGSPPFLSWT